jgi:hypothetical protein
LADCLQTIKCRQFILAKINRLLSRQTHFLALFIKKLRPPKEGYLMRNALLDDLCLLNKLELLILHDERIAFATLVLI